MVSRTLFLTFSLLSLGVEASEVEVQENQPLPAAQPLNEAHLTPQDRQYCNEVIQKLTDSINEYETKSPEYWTQLSDSFDNINSLDKTDPLYPLKKAMYYAEGLQASHQGLAEHMDLSNSKIVAQIALDLLCGKYDPDLQLQMK